MLTRDKVEDIAYTKTKEILSKDNIHEAISVVIRETYINAFMDGLVYHNKNCPIQCINVDNRLPDDDSNCLVVCYSKGKIYVGKYQKENARWIDSNTSDVIEDVTHWASVSIFKL